MREFSTKKEIIFKKKDSNEKASFLRSGNNELTNNFTNDKNELIIKKLTLLYAFEKEFYKVITKSIEDE